MKDYILKEYGSWAVFLISFITGLIVSQGLRTSSLYMFIALIILVNSKQSFSLFLRRGDKVALIAFLGQIILAILLLLYLSFDIKRFLFYAIIPLLYFVLFILKGEHFLLTEVSGFAVLTLSSSLSYYTVTGSLDDLLYLTTFIYFASGVFKVRVYLKKDILHRAIMFTYIITVFLFSIFSGVNIMIFFPLIENIIFALFLYRVKLSFIGWTEVLKGLIFILLMAGLYE